MRYLSGHMERVTTATRVTGGVSMVVGLGLLGFAVVLNQWAGDGASRAMAFGGAVLYLLPGALLYALAWRMEKVDPWAYLATAAISLVLLARYFLAVVASRVAHVQFYGDPLICETLCRLPCILLVIGCLNAMPDVRDVYRTRRRERQAARRGFEPIIAGAPLTRLPPPPIHSVQRFARNAPPALAPLPPRAPLDPPA